MTAPQPPEFFRKLKEVSIVTFDVGTVPSGTGVILLNRVRFTVPRGDVDCMLGIGYRPSVPGDTLDSTDVVTPIGSTNPVTEPGLIQFTPVVDAVNGNGDIRLPNLFADADRPDIPYAWTFNDLADYVDVSLYYDTALADYASSAHTGELVVFATVKYVGSCCDPCFVADLLNQAQLANVQSVKVGTGGG